MIRDTVKNHKFAKPRKTDTDHYMGKNHKFAKSRGIDADQYLCCFKKKHSVTISGLSILVLSRQ